MNPDIIKEIARLSKSSKSAAEALEKLEAYFKENDLNLSVEDVRFLKDDKEFEAWANKMQKEHKHTIEITCEAHATVTDLGLSSEAISDGILFIAKIADIINNKTSGSFIDVLEGEAEDDRDMEYELEVKVTRRKKKEEQKAFFYNPAVSVKL